MTPSEKAVDLFTRMKGFRVKHSHSKKCAMVAVEQILAVIGDEIFSEYEYWNEVKKELTKLK